MASESCLRKNFGRNGRTRYMGTLGRTPFRLVHAILPDSHLTGCSQGLSRIVRMNLSPTSQGILQCGIVRRQGKLRVQFPARWIPSSR